MLACLVQESSHDHTSQKLSLQGEVYAVQCNVIGMAISCTGHPVELPQLICLETRLLTQSISTNLPQQHPAGVGGVWETDHLGQMTQPWAYRPRAFLVLPCLASMVAQVYNTPANSASGGTHTAYTQTHTQTHKQVCMYRQTYRHTHIQTDTHRHRRVHSDSPRGTHADMHAVRSLMYQTGRHARLCSSETQRLQAYTCT